MSMAETTFSVSLKGLDWRLQLRILASEVVEGLTRVIEGCGSWRFERFWRFCVGGCWWGRWMTVVESMFFGILEGSALMLQAGILASDVMEGLTRLIVDCGAWRLGHFCFFGKVAVGGGGG
jgi:hypothetical protein